MKQRTPLTKLNNSELQFVNKSSSGDLTALSLDELAQRYISIEQQSQFYKGLILLEARERFKSDKEFGEWVVTNGLSVGTTQQNRTVFMNLARFFKDREMSGISLTCAYEISRPNNAGVAEDVYAQVVNKKLSVAEVKKIIEQAKLITIDTDSAAEFDEERKEALLNDESNHRKALIRQISNTLKKSSLSKEEKIQALKTCISTLEHDE
jgi:hypothetical protein